MTVRIADFSQTFVGQARELDRIGLPRASASRLPIPTSGAASGRLTGAGRATLLLTNDGPWPYAKAAIRRLEMRFSSASKPLLSASPRK